jgi:hypothetical protein
MFHFNVQTVIDAFLDYAMAHDFAPEVMAYLKVRPDKLDDTQSQLANDHLVGASPRGWEDISNVLKSDLSDAPSASSCRGASAPPTPRSSSACCEGDPGRHRRAGLLEAEPGEETAALLPTTLDGLYGMIYALLAAATDEPAHGPGAGHHRAAAGQEPEPLPIREAQTLAMELLFQKALERGLEGRCSPARPIAATGATRAAGGWRRSMAEAGARHPYESTAAPAPSRRWWSTRRPPAGLALWVHHRDWTTAAPRPWSPPTTAPPSTTARPSRRCPAASRPGWSPIRCCTSPCATRPAPRPAAAARRRRPELYNICADAIVNSALSHLSWLELPRGSVRLEDLLAVLEHPPGRREGAAGVGPGAALPRRRRPRRTSGGRQAVAAGAAQQPERRRRRPRPRSRSRAAPSRAPRGTAQCAVAHAMLGGRLRDLLPAADAEQPGGRGRAGPRMARAHHPRPRRRRRALHAARPARRPAQGPHPLGAAAAHPARPRPVHAPRAVLVAPVALLSRQPGRTAGRPARMPWEPGRASPARSPGWR